MLATIRCKIWHQRHSGKDCKSLKWKSHPPFTVPLSGTSFPPFELQSFHCLYLLFWQPSKERGFLATSVDKFALNPYLNSGRFFFLFSIPSNMLNKPMFQKPSMNCHLHRMKRTPKFFLCLFLPFCLFFGVFKSQNHTSPAGPSNTIFPVIPREAKATYCPHREQSAGHQMYTKF